MACWLAPAVLAQEIQEGETGDQRVVEAVYWDAGEEVVLDGRLDEDAWQQIEPITAFRQQEPVEGGMPSEETEVRIAHDGTHLYIGAVLHDSEPDRVLGYQRRRNANLSSDDRFMWIIDTFGDGRTAYYFETNPAGVKGDGMVSGGNRDKSRDGIWDVRVARGDYGWSVEARIPLRTLNFNPDLEAWGINFQRTIRRKNEEVVWSGHRRNQGLFRPQHAGRLTGMSGLSQGVGLQVTPYASGSASSSAAFGTEQDADAGFDVTYSLTTNLRASLTVNTDFAEVEVDDRQVNLSRFPAFFPERREFFLEADNVFTFAPRGGVRPFQSRQIGLHRGDPVPIRLGARLAGQVGDYDVGFYQVRTGQEQVGPEVLVPAEDFTAARVVRNILSESTVGVIYTRRATHQLDGQPELHDGHTAGADLELRTSRFMGDNNLEFQAYYVWNSSRDPLAESSVLDRSARGVRLSFPNDPWSGNISYREIGEAYDPAMGFNRRRGFRRLQPTVSYAPYWESNPFIRQVGWELRFEYLTGMDFRPETVSTRFTFLEVDFESGDDIETGIEREYERLPIDFDILRDGSIIIPAGEYSGWNWSAEASTANHRMVSGDAGISYGAFWTGVRTQYEAGATLRTLWGATVSGDWRHDVVTLREGDFSTHLVRLTGDLDLTTDTSFRANIQYDNLSDQVGVFTRFRWIIQPGSDLYLVYSHNWLYNDDRLHTLQQGGATKLTYTHQF